MPGEASRIYFDANVFLAYVSDEVDRAAVVEEFLRKANAGDLTIMSSTLSVVEVAYGAEEKLHGGLNKETEARIDQLWIPGSPVKLIEASRRVLLEARTLIRSNLEAGRGRLTPIDAIHLATAMLENVDKMMTYETGKQEQWALLTGLRVDEPSLAQPPLDFGSN